MESISENQSFENILKKSKTLNLKKQLSLSNQKTKYKKQFIRLDSYQKNNDTCEMTGISWINSINPANTPKSSSPNKRPKGRVAFAPNFRLINYVYFDPKDKVVKEEKIEEKDEKMDDGEKEDNSRKEKIEANDKVTFQCTCHLM